MSARDVLRAIDTWLSEMTPEEFAYIQTGLKDGEANE